LSGDIKLNDTIKLDITTFSKIGAYVMQDDHLFSFFTPKEALTFAARLKLHNVSVKDQDIRINSLLKDLSIPKDV
jgi:ABC-type multidrug transport system ATPase subunit